MERPRDLDGGGPAGHRHACSDRAVHGNQEPSVGGRAGAVHGVLCHDSGSRLRDACVAELKEHRSRRRLELLTRGLKSKLRSSLAEFRFQVPRSGAGRCAKAVFLRTDGAIRHFPIQTP